jgi:hypothetical protein
MVRAEARWLMPPHLRLDQTTIKRQNRGCSGARWSFDEARACAVCR